MLTVAVGISAGVGALVSALPRFQPYTLWLCLAILAMITVVNLRGVRESGVAFIAPTYLFIATLLAVIAIGVGKTLLSGDHPDAVEPPACSRRRQALAADASVCQRLHGDDGRGGRQQRRDRVQGTHG